MTQPVTGRPAVTPGCFGVKYSVAPETSRVGEALWCPALMQVTGMETEIWYAELRLPMMLQNIVFANNFKTKQPLFANNSIDFTEKTRHFLVVFAMYLKYGTESFHRIGIR